MKEDKKTEKKSKKIKKTIVNAETETQKMSTVTRKFTLHVDTSNCENEEEAKKEVSRVFNYIRNGMKIQAQMMNLCMSAFYSARKNNMPTEEYKKLSISFGQIPAEKNKDTSAYYGIIDASLFPKGIALAGSVPYIVKKKLDTAYEAGLNYGKVSLPSFRDNGPMFVQKDLVLPDTYVGKGKRSSAGFHNPYDSMDELYQALTKKSDPGIKLKFANKIVFDVVFGNPYNGAGLRLDMWKVFSGAYQVCDSKIGIDKDNKIQLYLSVKEAVKQNVLIETRVCGVDLGMVVPATCALNDNLYRHSYIGCFDELIAFRAKKQCMRQRIQSQLKNSRGGHGRKKKLAALEKYEKYISNYAKTYNHKIAKQVVEFAVKNQCAYIQLEDLSGIKKQKNKDEKSKDFERILDNWSVFDLQQDIIYKAKREGIKIRFVKPEYTSQTCSVCGMRGMRPKQDVFICSNPDCKCNEIYEKFNKKCFADFNAAKNIAMSTNYVTAQDEKEENIA